MRLMLNEGHAFGHHVDCVFSIASRPKGYQALSIKRSQIAYIHFEFKPRKIRVPYYYSLS